jgi:hypothetical protein
MKSKTFFVDFLDHDPKKILEKLCVQYGIKIMWSRSDTWPQLGSRKKLRIPIATTA